MAFKKSVNISSFFIKEIAGYASVVVIDFNYTQSIKAYVEELQKDNNEVNIIHIHGTNEDGNEIFGYGDDLSSEYMELKEMDEDYLMEHFKTINYNMANEYSEFNDEILSNTDFDAFIIGHSLGKTDRTLLKEIFDNEHCQKINIPKRGDLNANPEKQRKAFKTLQIAITRVMGDESDVRKKVSNFTSSIIFP